MNARCPRLMFLTLSLVIAMLQPGMAVAQGGATATGATTSPYVTVSGQELAWADPWVFVENDAMRTSDLDLVFLTDGTATVAVSTGGIFPENARGLVIGFLGGDTDLVEILDQGTGDVTSYWFDAFPVDGEPYGAFSVATTLGADSALLVMYISPVSAFGEGMASAQSSISLGGQPLFASVDGMALQAQLGGPANVATDTALPEFVPQSQWVDRTYDVQLMWDKTWLPLGPDGEHGFRLGSVDSTTLLTITIAPREGTTPQEWADAQVKGRDDNWGTYTYLPQYVGEDDVLTIGLETSGLGGIVQEVLFLEDAETIAIVSMVVLNADPLTVVETYRASVRIDGGVPLEDVDLASMVAEMECNGLHADGSYISPQYAVGLEWDSAAWAPWPSLEEAAMSNPSHRTDGFMLASRNGPDTSLIVFIGSTEGLELEGFVTYNADPDMYLSNYGQDVSLLETVVEGTRAANVFLQESPTGPMLIYETYELAKDGSVLVVIVLVTPAPSMAQTLPAAQAEISLEGEPVLDILTVEEIMKLLAA